MTTLDGDEGGLLDRKSVLREIDALICEAKTRSIPCVVRVTGPPGIGKTAVLRAVARTAGNAVPFATAEAAFQTEPGFAARRLLREDPAAPRANASFRNELHALAAEAGAIIVDDVQWIDEQTLRDLLSALRSCAHVAIVLGDRRTHAPEWPKHETIELAPLRRAATVELVRRYYPAAPPAVAAEIAEAADGVPFVVTILALDAATRDVKHAGDAAPSVGAVIARRLARLSATAQDAARLLSLVEPPLALDVLARALDVKIDGIAAVMAELRDLVALDGPFVAFRHHALATAVAASVPNTVGAYAQLLGAYEGERASLAAIVRCALGCGRRESAAVAALELARGLAREGSLGSALRYAEIALDNAPQPVSAEYVVEYAVALHLLSRNMDSASFLRHTIRAAIESSDAASAAEMVAAFFSAAVPLERFTELEGLCERVERLAGHAPAVVQRTRGVRLASLAYAGRLDEYVALSAETTNGRWTDARAAAFVHALRGDVDRAEQELATYAVGLGAKHARQTTADRMLETIIAFFYRGRRALDALEALPASGVRHPSERALRVLGRVCDGCWDEAALLLGAEHDEDADDPDQVLEVRVLLSALRREGANDARALRTLRSMIKRGSVRHAAPSARWYVLACGPNTPADIASFARETLETPPMPDTLTGWPLSIAMLVERFGSARCKAAIERYPVFETPWHRAHHELAAGLVAHSNERIRAARTAFDELNCPALAAVAGITLPAPRSRDVATAQTLGLLHASPPDVASLTRRERAIAEHTATGASNQEIGEALSISVRTVETHLTKIYAKLGVASRGALTALMHRQSL